MNKYGNKKTIVNGIVFDSQKEANRYRELILLQKAGEISNLERQKSYLLLPAGHGERAVKYIADFVYMENGKLIVEDVKGFKTKEYIIKRKLFKSKYCSDNVIFREI